MFKRNKKLQNPDLDKMTAVSSFDATGLYQTPPKSKHEEENYASSYDAVSDIDTEDYDDEEDITPPY
jgi:hypothetical protein